jgi:hypothetical protein
MGEASRGGIPFASVHFRVCVSKRADGHQQKARGGRRLPDPPPRSLPPCGAEVPGRSEPRNAAEGGDVGPKEGKRGLVSGTPCIYTSKGLPGLVRSFPTRARGFSKRPASDSTRHRGGRGFPAGGSAARCRASSAGPRWSADDLSFGQRLFEPGGSTEKRARVDGLSGGEATAPSRRPPVDRRGGSVVQLLSAQ